MKGDMGKLIVIFLVLALIFFCISATAGLLATVP